MTKFPWKTKMSLSQRKSPYLERSKRADKKAQAATILSLSFWAKKSKVALARPVIATIAQ